MTLSSNRPSGPAVVQSSRKAILRRPYRNLFRITNVLLFLLLSMAAVTAQAQTDLVPGDTVVLVQSDESPCVRDVINPTTSGLITNAHCEVIEEVGVDSKRHQNLFAHSGITLDSSIFGQRAISTARLNNRIRIVDPPLGIGSEVLPVQVSTEVSWSGVLIAAGMYSTFAQVVATLQVRDMVTEEVVASNTFLSERYDAETTLEAEELPDSGADVTNSSGADVTALLLRGRIYAIEVEAKCEISVPLGVGVAVCSFYDIGDLPAEYDIISESYGFGDLLSGDGFDVANVTVSVGSDLVESLTSN